MSESQSLQAILAIVENKFGKVGVSVDLIVRHPSCKEFHISFVSRLDGMLLTQAINAMALTVHGFSMVHADPEQTMVVSKT